jgi:hypothetical protein
MGCPLGLVSWDFSRPIYIHDLVFDLDFARLVNFTHGQNASFMMSESALDNFADNSTRERHQILCLGEVPSMHGSAPNVAGVSATGVLRRDWPTFNSSIAALRSYARPG